MLNPSNLLNRTIFTGNSSALFSGATEIGEPFLGWNESNKHADKKINANRINVGKTVAVSVNDRRAKKAQEQVMSHDYEDLPGFAGQYPSGATSRGGRATSCTELIGHNKDAVIGCMDNIEFMSILPDGKFKLVVTSPPYNLGKFYEDKLSLDEYLSKQARVIDECVRLVDSQGSICWQVGNYVCNGEIVPLDSLLYPLFLKHGLKLRNRIVWHFGHGLHCTKRLSGRYETINWWTKGDNYTWHLDPIRIPQKYPNKKHFRGPNAGKLSSNPKGKNPSDVWELPNVKSNHPEKTIHPSQFPVELVERLVLSMTDEGDCVFDPYMGVGSTIIAAVRHGRKGYGCDIVKEYVEIARERIRDLQAGTLRTRPMGLPIYDPDLPNGGH